MVAAVPMVMQVPGERAMVSSMSCHSRSVIPPGAQLVPVFPGIGTRAQRLVAPVAVQHGARRQVDRRQVHAGRAHDERRRGLVAAAHQHAAVHRVGAQQFLGFHGEEVAVHHGGRLLHGFGERHGRHFQREAARLPDAALHFLGALAEVGVAVVDVRPGIDDRNDRLARVVGAVVAHLRGARAMAEGAQVLDAEPSVRAQFFGLLFLHDASSGERRL